MAGMFEDEEPWVFVKPAPNVVTVFPSDIMQYLTKGYLLSTPHKVRNTRERFALAYFHEPSFKACVVPFDGIDIDEIDNDDVEYIHYGAHFTDMFMQCYKDPATTHRIIDDDRLSKLSLIKM